MSTLDRIGDQNELRWWRRVVRTAEGGYILPYGRPNGEHPGPHFLRIESVREWLSDHHVRADLKTLATERILAAGADTDVIRVHLAQSYAHYTLDDPALAKTRIDTVLRGLVAGVRSTLSPSEQIILSLIRESNVRINRSNAEILATLSRIEGNYSIAPNPTEAIDNWRIVTRAPPLEEQFRKRTACTNELPDCTVDATIEALEDEVGAILKEAHKGGKPIAPACASKPTINLYNRGKPAKAIVVSNGRLMTADSGSDVRHIVLDFGDQAFPVLEGQCIGIVPPGLSADGKPQAVRLYSIASSRDGEKPNANHMALTVKREPGGVCSNYVCDLPKGAKVEVTGPYGASFLMPNDPSTSIIMICTGTGSAPFRGFIERRRRAMPQSHGQLLLFLGARRSEKLPYFGALQKIPTKSDKVAALLCEPRTFVYISGLKGTEAGADEDFAEICHRVETDWSALKDRMRSEGRYHVQTY